MNQNLLVERLKFAKRELTALKTAHLRGLGNLRVYRRLETLITPAVERGSYELFIEISFSSNYAPYPFVNVLAGPEIDGVALYGFDEFEYTENGRKARVVGGGLFYRPSLALEYEIISTAPVNNISVTWREL